MVGRPVEVATSGIPEDDGRSVQRRYAGSINRLPGVTGFTAPKDENAFITHLLSSDDQHQLEKTLQPTVEGRPMTYRVHERLRA